MSTTKSVGKNTVGDNNKMKVRLNNYYRSTHDLSYVWKNTQAVGTLVPFLCEYAQIDDTHEIDLNAMVITHPTVGPLYGSFKLQVDLYVAPIRLYQKLLHNNTLGIGLDMSKVKLPQISVIVTEDDIPTNENQFTQINPSALLAYLGIRGWGLPKEGVKSANSQKNAIPLLAYWDIWKNYYANKQEENGYVCTSNGSILMGAIRANNTTVPVNDFSKDILAPTTNQIQIIVNTTPAEGTEKIKPEDITIHIEPTGSILEKTASMVKMFGEPETESNGSTFTWTINNPNNIMGIFQITYNGAIILKSFETKYIDEIREEILAAPSTSPYIVDSVTPFTYRARGANKKLITAKEMHGLAVKTYQSDIFNNWIQTEWLEGENGINAITSVDTSGGSFTMDTLNLAKKVYNMLNRIAVSDGTYKSWMETVFSSKYVERTETPVYYGGMSQEIIFEEVISTSASDISGNEPLGSLAGKGRLAPNRKGGKVVIKIDEPSYIIGIVSITPRLDYSQGNNFTANWETLNDVHKPALDMIGFQDLTLEKAAWWTEKVNENNVKEQKSVGKTVAWVDYMTNFNKNYGNFATGMNENFMVLDRNYNIETEDFTTYIDPEKWNGIFADQSRGAMNFWLQIGVDWKVRRKISAKSIPNL